MRDLNIQDTFNKELPADPILENSRRQVLKACFSYVSPRKPSQPTLLHTSQEMLEELGMTREDADQREFLEIFSGVKVLPDTRPYAMCYGGHQFGSWAGQLGDGRAINLGEIKNQDKRWALQLKGAGETPYSRSADGLAVLRSSVREHLCSEAMFHLDVPTTRSLSLITTGDQVLRDVMYNGNAAYEKGAVICRVAPTFIRFGNFQLFTARKDLENLKILADYTIKYFFPEIKGNDKDRYIQFFAKVAELTLDLVIEWQRVGFVHGVMNTDNMSILGLTVDYGPYGWLEGYDPDWTPNTTDRSTRRYRYGHQPSVALWNVAQLGNALYPLVNDEAPLQKVLENFQNSFFEKYADMMRSKLGLDSKQPGDPELIAELENVLTLVETDMTIFFRNLSGFVAPASGLTNQDVRSILDEAIYIPEATTEDILSKWRQWLEKYQQRMLKDDISFEERKKRMNKINPKYVLRNYMAQLAIDQAQQGGFTLLEEIHQLLKSPYDDQPENIKWFGRRPEWARHKVGCSMLSCSS